MICTISVVSPNYIPLALPVEVGAREVAAMRAYLRAFDPFHQNHELATYQDHLGDFTASVSHHSIAKIASFFPCKMHGICTDMLAVIEEANYARMRIRFHQRNGIGHHVASVSNLVDQCEPVMVEQRALHLIKRMTGHAVNEENRIPLDQLVSVIKRDDIYDTMATVGLQKGLPALRYAAASHKQHPMALLAWA